MLSHITEFCSFQRKHKHCIHISHFLCLFFCTYTFSIFPYLAICKQLFNENESANNNLNCDFNYLFKYREVALLDKIMFTSFVFEGISFFFFFRNHTILHSHQQHARVLIPSYLCPLVFLLLININYSDRCEMVFNCF